MEINKETIETIQSKVSEKMQEETKNLVTKEELTNVSNDITKANETIETVKGAVDGIALEIKGMKEMKKEEVTVDGLTKEIKAIEDFKGQIVKGKEIELKALSNRASISNNTDSMVIPEIGQLGVKERSLYNIFPKMGVPNGNNNGVIRYHDWDEATTVRAAAMVAEGGTFPESTAKFIEYTLPLRKIGDSLPVTEEFFEDEVSASGELKMFLQTNVATKIDDQIANGDGTGENLKGLIASTPAYTPVASGITGANIYDLVKKVRTDITKNRGSKYSPDFVAMNSDTMDRLQLEKDANDNYIFPDKTSIGSMVIVEDNNIPDNQLVVGDRRYARIYEKGGVVVSEDRVNNQFLTDSMTLKARVRMLFLIRTVDQTGFRKVTDITAALATLAS